MTSKKELIFFDNVFTTNSARIMEGQRKGGGRGTEGERKVVTDSSWRLVIDSEWAMLAMASDHVKTEGERKGLGSSQPFGDTDGEDEV